MAGSTLRCERQFWRKMCQLLRKNCFWLTHSKHVTRGYRAWGDRQNSVSIKKAKGWVVYSQSHYLNAHLVIQHLRKMCCPHKPCTVHTGHDKELNILDTDMTKKLLKTIWDLVSKHNGLTVRLCLFSVIVKNFWIIMTNWVFWGQYKCWQNTGRVEYNRRGK